MTDREVTILDLLAERDRTTATKLQAITDLIGELRADVRSQREQLLGVATGAEIASLKRTVNGEIDALAGRVTLLERRLDTREAVEQEAAERRQRRAWIFPSSASFPVGVALLLAGGLLERFVL